MSLHPFSEQRKVLNIFFNKLASGDDVTELISTLRKMMQSHKTRESTSLAEHDKVIFNNINSVGEICCCDTNGVMRNVKKCNVCMSSLTHNKLSHSYLRAALSSKMETCPVTNTINVISSSNACNDLSICESNTITHYYRKATKLAFLFAAESNTAMEEATHLYYSPSTWACTRWRDNRVLALGRNELCTMLSDRAAAVVAREIMQKSHNWLHALRVLSNVEQTSITRNGGIEICSSAMLWMSALELLYGNDVKNICNRLEKWREENDKHEYNNNISNKNNACHALVEMLSKIQSSNDNNSNSYLHKRNVVSTEESSQWETSSVNESQKERWEEINVVKVIRAFYHAALYSCKVQHNENNLLHNEEKYHGDEMHQELLSVPKPDECSKEARAFYTFPLALINEAVRCHNVQFTTVSAINDALGLLSLSSLYTEDGCKLLRELLACDHNINIINQQNETNKEYANDAFHETPHLWEVETEQMRNGTLTNHWLLPFVKANAITVYHTCNLLYNEPKKAQFYVEALIRKYDIAIECDDAACASYLWLCLQEDNVDNTINMVKKRLRFWITKFKGSCCIAPKTPPFPPNLFIAIVKLFAKHSCCANVQDIIADIFDWTQTSCNQFKENYQLTSSSCDTEHEQSWRSEKYRFSRAYNTNTISRAYNTLIQETGNIELVEMYVSKIEDENNNNSECENSNNDNKNIELENESITHLSELYAENGDWQKALNLITEIMETPERDRLFFPSAKLHDALQMSLEQAEISNAPSYKVSLKLFNQMCERNVPLSEIAFHYVVKQCFKQGAVNEAHELLKKMVKHGVNQ